MKLVIQRVSSSSCTVDNKIISSIDKGYLILIGFKSDDNNLLFDKLVKKIINLRIFEDDEGKMNRSILDVGGKILLISQFTLYGDVKHGNRPSFTNAMKFDEANKLYEELFQKLNEKIETKRGLFGADMKINLLNDGPVTIIIDGNDL